MDFGLEVAVVTAAAAVVAIPFLAWPVVDAIADRRRQGRRQPRTSDQLPLAAKLGSGTGKLVDRPELLDDLVRTLTKGGDGRRTVALTTALRGAGGFGKTTLAVQACWKLKDRFPDGILWCTMGQETTGADLASKINDLAFLLSGERPTLIDPEQAGNYLGRLLGNGRRLLVIDDVWRIEQLTPFLAGGPRCVRLVTTRVHSALPDNVDPIRVDAMTGAESRAMLALGLPEPLPDLSNLLRLTGGWAVLLRLVNGVLRRELREPGAEAGRVVAQVEARLARGGPGALDRRTLNVANPTARAQAVSATMEASLGLLTADQRDRYLELAVFPDDIDVPLPTLERYWGLDDDEAVRLCQEFDDLSIVQDHSFSAKPSIRLHDVVLEYLRSQLNRDQSVALNRKLLDRHRSLLPAGQSWWELPAREDYLWSHVAHHMGRAGINAELEALVCDLRWVIAKLERLGPAGIDADLALASGGVAIRLRQTLAQNAHLLQPGQALTPTLLSRLEPVADLAPVVQPYLATFQRPRLAPVWPLPDLPDSGLRRVLTGHRDSVYALVASPDGSWLASAGEDGTVRLWDPLEGRERATLTGHSGSVSSLVVSPDGSWLASAGSDGTVRMWDPVEGRERATLTGHRNFVSALVVSPDGSWLASAPDSDGTVRLWDPVEGRERATLTGHRDPQGALGLGVSVLAVSPVGSWLASADDSDGTVRLWDPVEGRERATLTGDIGSVRAMAVNPDGSWLASAGSDGNVHLWDPLEGREHATLTRNVHLVSVLAGIVNALVVSPDGSWLASAAGDGTVHLWDPVEGRERATLIGHRGWVFALAVSPDGSWLASAGEDGTVRLWEPVGGRGRATLTGHRGWVNSLAPSPDGSWLASAGYDGTVRLWDPVEGRERATLIGDIDWYDEAVGVGALAVSPDGSWLASGHGDGTVRLWDPVEGRERATLAGGDIDWESGAVSVNALAVSPDGSWLASAGGDGTVRLWDPIEGRERATLIGHRGSVDALVVCPDGSWLASADRDGTVRLWDPVEGRERATLTGHRGWRSALAVSPDGSWLASAGEDGTVRLWDPIEGRQRATLIGHRGSVNALVVSPDGSWLASAGSDGTVRLWDPVEGRERANLTGHRNLVTAMAVSSDGSWLASAGYDGTVRLWDPLARKPLTTLQVDGYLAACCWLHSRPVMLCVCGARGLYVIEYRA